MYNDEYYMNKALLLAKEAADCNETPVGAIIVKNNKIIGAAHNYKDISKLVTNHAELIAIEQASRHEKDWRLCGATIYVTMEPCPMCASAIQQSRIERLVYGCSSNNAENTKIIEKILQNDKFNHQATIKKGILDKECASLIKNFFKEKR